MAMARVLPFTEMTAMAPARRAPWRRYWPLAVSVLAHLGLLVGFLLTWTDSAPPPPLPQIELLPPAPVPPMPEEAAPSPAEAVLKPLPAFPKLAPPPPAPLPPKPLVTTSATTERLLPKPPKSPPPKPPAPDAPPVLDPPPSPASEAAATPVSGSKAASNTLQGDAAAPRAAGPPPDYLGLIRGRLEKAKRYPPAARAAGQEGTVRLAFTLDRGGQLINWKIVASSGVGLLDEETEALVQRASFPPFPASLDQDRLELTVPVEFSLTVP
jgi:protein TonB